MDKDMKVTSRQPCRSNGRQQEDSQSAPVRVLILTSSIVCAPFQLLPAPDATLKDELTLPNASRPWKVPIKPFRPILLCVNGLLKYVERTKQ